MDTCYTNLNLNNPSFFKILLNPSAKNLKLPPAFVNQYLKPKIPKNPVLRTKNGESWEMKMEKIDGKYCFVNGWTGFANDNLLETGDFLVFWLIDDSTFQVAIYGVSGCEKQLASPVSPNLNPHTTGEFNCVNGSTKTSVPVEREIKIEEESDFEVLEISESSEESTNLYFERVLQQNRIHNMFLDKGFVEESGLGNGTEPVVIRNARRKEWAVRIVKSSNGEYFLGEGWKRFCIENCLSVGNICCFHFHPRRPNLIQLIVKRGRVGRPRSVKSFR